MREIDSNRRWADAVWNGHFYCISTRSGYGGGMHIDPKGAQHLLSIEASHAELGVALLDSLCRSRFVVARPRSDVLLHPEVQFDEELSDPKLSHQRYEEWVEAMMSRFGYKTRRALFKDMHACDIELDRGSITIRPNRHERLEAWGRDKGDGIENVVIPVGSSPTEIGAALKLAFSRCTT